MEASRGRSAVSFSPRLSQDGNGAGETEADDVEAEAEDPAEPEEKAAETASQRLGADLRRTRRLKALLLSKYDEVWAQSEGMGWALCEAEWDEEPTDWNICWSDTSVALERIMRMGRIQKINHFPGMLELVRKAGTARNLNKMLLAVGKDYKFFPRTFMLPADYTELKKEFKGKHRGNKTFIIKPSRGCQGKDIQLTRNLDEINPHEPNIVQRYLHR